MLMAAVQKEYAIVYFTQSKIKNPILSFLIWNFAIESNDDDDGDDDELFVVWLTGERLLALFPPGTIVRDPHHRESLTRREQDLNLRRT